MTSSREKGGRGKKSPNKFRVFSVSVDPELFLYLEKAAAEHGKSAFITTLLLEHKMRHETTNSSNNADLHEEKTTNKGKSAKPKTTNSSKATPKKTTNRSKPPKEETTISTIASKEETANSSNETTISGLEKAKRPKRKKAENS